MQSSKRLVLAALMLCAACVRRLPGNADVPAADKYLSATGARTNTNELAGRVMATYPNLIHDPALDDAAKVLAEDVGHSHELPSPLYIQELLWRRGSIARYRYARWGWQGGRGGTAQLDAMLASVLEQETELDGRAFGIHRTRIAYVMLIADAPVVLDPLPRKLAPSEPFTLSGKLRTAGDSELLLWGPGDISPRQLLANANGAWEPVQLQAPATPGRYFIELASTGRRAERLLLVPITVGAAPTAELDRVPPDGPQAVEDEARRIITAWRATANRPPLAADPAADARARRDDKASDDGAFQSPHSWMRKGNSPHAWDYALLELLAPDVAGDFVFADGDLLAVGASNTSDMRQLRVEVLKRR